MRLDHIEDILYCNKNIVLEQVVCDEIKQCFKFLSVFVKDKIIYGINTGFGPMSQYKIDDNDLEKLQYNIIRSHSSGAGKPLSDVVVKAAMLSRMQTFTNAKSGVSPDVVKTLIAFINNNITPYIPQHGGVGASGDLVQLAHLGLSLIGEGKCYHNEELMPTKKALDKCGIAPLKLKLRDGLALCNGTSIMTGLGIVNLCKAKKLLRWSIISSVLINEIAASYDDFLSPILNEVKNHLGQQNIAREMREIAASSTRLLVRKDVLYNGCQEETKITHKVQPYYSLRCVPQILGPILETIENVEKILLEEFNSVDDNPIIDMATENVLHGGNFHGDYVSFEMDKLKIAITKLVMLTERQLNYLLHDKINEILPPFVNLGKLGLNYGLQAAQFTATSTTAECQTLSNPMYIHSIPNNNDNQDIVSMGTNSGLLAQRVIDNGFQVMAIHLMALVQAVDCLDIKDKLSTTTRELYNSVRKIVPTFIEDTPKYEEIALLIEFLDKENLN